MNREEENDDVVLQGSGVVSCLRGTRIEDRLGLIPWGLMSRKVLEEVAGGPKFV